MFFSVLKFCAFLYLYEIRLGGSILAAEKSLFILIPFYKVGVA